MSDAYAFEQPAASAISVNFTAASRQDLPAEQLRVVDRTWIGFVPLSERPLASSDGCSTPAPDLGGLRGVGIDRYRSGRGEGP